MNRLTSAIKGDHSIFVQCLYFILSIISLSLPNPISAENSHNFKETNWIKREFAATEKDRRVGVVGQSAPDFAKLILKWTNTERKKQRVPALMISPVLSKIAQTHSTNQAGVGLMAHDSAKFPIGWQTFGERIKKLHFPGPAAYGENVFWTSAKLPLTLSGRNDYSRKVVQAWMSSPGHRRNILSPKFSFMGIGFSNGYVTQLFSSKGSRN